MVTGVAPPKNTGGGGFVFEETVCALLLAHMLAGETPFAPQCGTIERVGFQVRPDGWFLDDVLVTTIAANDRHRFALSIKSNAQLTGTSAPTDFVGCVWAQWLHEGSTVFTRENDFLVLVTGPLSKRARDSVDGIVMKARAAPAELASRIDVSRWASEDERHMFDSFECPAKLAEKHPGAHAQTAALLARLAFVDHDFGAPISGSEKEALRICTSCLRDGGPDEAAALWTWLLMTASELRPYAGSIDRVGLIARLGSQFTLAEHPDYRADWQQLQRVSRETAETIQQRIAGRVCLDRSQLVTDISDQLASHPVILGGRSGSGKSSVARSVFEGHVDANNAIWIDASVFEIVDVTGLEQRLRLRYALSELMASTTAAAPLLVIDGLDRIFSAAPFQRVATIIRHARPPSPAKQWQLLITCQSTQWSRVSDALLQNGITGIEWSVVDVPYPTGNELAPVRTEIRELTKLFHQPSVANVLGNLKILDLVARRAIAGGNVEVRWVGEASVAHWFWEAEIDRGADRVARGRFARKLAELQGDELVSSIRIDRFDPALDTVAGALVTDRVCTELVGDRIGFEHELYGDWARLRLLIAEENFADYARTRDASPLWHRAIRLYALYLLEHRSDQEAWISALAAVRKQPVLHDLLLEAPVFAADPRPLLDAVLQRLLEGDAELLQRMLTRFLAFATTPNEPMIRSAIASGEDAAAARALYRLPLVAFWAPMLRFLHAHRDEVVSRAPVQISRIVEMWQMPMRFGRDVALRNEVAELAVLLGRVGLATRDVSGDREWEADRRRFFRCALEAAPQQTEACVDIARRAAERVQPDETDGQRLWREPKYEPGPGRRVDDAFQDVVLETLAILPLLRVQPGVATEVVLACLISPREDLRDSYSNNLSLVERYEWHPPSYFHGPFLGCLRASFPEGLDMIAALVEFATARRCERDPGAAPVQIIVDNEQATFLGGASVFGWSAGLGNAPQCVEAALMALEQYCYQHLDKGIDDVIAAVLRRTRSIAFIKVLLDVGKRMPRLFSGALRELLAVHELYDWDLGASIASRQPLLAGSHRDPFFVQLAREFHELGHRHVPLRELAHHMMFEMGLQDLFLGVIAGWARRDENGAPEDLRLFLDPNKWTLSEDGRSRNNEELARLVDAHRERDRGLDDGLSVLTFPARARMILDEATDRTESQLASLWDTWTRLFAFRDQAEHEALDQATAGGLAVFAKHGEWLHADPARTATVVDQFRDLTFRAARQDVEARDDRLKWTRECFLAEAVTFLWLRTPDDAQLRREVARAVFTPQDLAVRLLFVRCECAAPSDRARLQRLAIERAFVRPLLDRIEELDEDSEIDTDDAREQIRQWQAERIECFVSGVLDDGTPTIADVNPCARFVFADRIMQGECVATDISLLVACHLGHPLPEDTAEATRRSCIDRWQDLFEIALRGGVDGGFPPDDDRWILKRVASVALQLRDDVDRARICDAICALPDDAHLWIEVFVRALNFQSLLSTPTPALYVAVLDELSTRIFARAPSWTMHDSVWDALIGIDDDAHDLWTPAHSHVIAALSAVYDRWIAGVPTTGTRVARFARWLARPVAAPVRLRAVSWFTRILVVDEEHEIYDAEQAEHFVATLLAAVWAEQQAVVRSQPQALEDLKSLLRHLASRQNATALALIGDMGGGI